MVNLTLCVFYDFLKSKPNNTFVSLIWPEGHLCTCCGLESLSSVAWADRLYNIKTAANIFKTIILPCLTLPLLGGSYEYSTCNESW